jgi:hypothetical protein
VLIDSPIFEAKFVAFLSGVSVTAINNLHEIHPFVLVVHPEVVDLSFRLLREVRIKLIQAVAVPLRKRLVKRLFLFRPQLLTARLPF